MVITSCAYIAAAELATCMLRQCWLLARAYGKLACTTPCWHAMRIMLKAASLLMPSQGVHIEGKHMGGSTACV
jgi:hypothetical protein